MAYSVRALGVDDIPAARDLGRLAFGGQARLQSQPPVDDGYLRHGAFDDAGRLVGKATDLEHGQWWGGRVVPASGIAGVAVVAEHRGRGVARQVMSHTLHAARDRGAVVANLYCTSAAVYRSLGFDVCGVLRHVRVPTVHLPALPKQADAEVSARTGTGRDWPAVRAVYDEIARTGQGLLSRLGPSFPADPQGEELPEGIDGVTLAVDPQGRALGYASYCRGEGYQGDSVLSVLDCLATDPAAARVLLGVLRTWQPVAPTVEFRPLPWADAVGAVLPLELQRERKAELSLHRPLDVAGAVAARGWAGLPDTEVTFRLVDPLIARNDATWRFEVADGEAQLSASSVDADAVLHVRGWSLLWCGQARAAQLRQAGWLRGGDARVDAALDRSLGAGVQAAMLDYF